MKNSIKLLSILLLLFISCTHEDNNIQNQNQEIEILPKRIVTVHGSNIETETYNYNGNKITEYTHADGSKDVYTYTSDYITKITNYKEKTVNRIEDYIYENGNVKSILTAENSTNDTTGEVTRTKSKTVYTHNSDGTILRESYSIDPKTLVEIKSNNTVTYTFVNGNLTKLVYFNSYMENTNTLTYEYEYDNKKSPFINVKNLYKIALDAISTNNLTKETYTSTMTSNGVIIKDPAPEITTLTNIFNTNNSLSKVEYKYNTGTKIESASVDYLYE